MSRHLTREALEQNAVVLAEPRAPTIVDRTFGLPNGLYAATVGLYLGFLAVMAFGFTTPGLAIPMVIFALFISAGFGVPALWTTMEPEHASRPLSWGRFRSEGIVTATGRVTAGDATAQVIVLPALIFAWGAITVTIAALV